MWDNVSWSDDGRCCSYRTLVLSLYVEQYCHLVDFHHTTTAQSVGFLYSGLSHLLTNLSLCLSFNICFSYDVLGLPDDF